MKKICVSFITLLLTVIFASSALATVGGPTLVSDLKYDPVSKLVYYTEQNYGGKGCPPELKSLDPISGQRKTIYSCDYGINKPQGYNQLSAISTFTKNFQTLEKVDMNKSDIFVEIKSTNYKPVQMFEAKKFIATIAQSDIVSKQFETTICEPSDPVTVDTYIIPSTTPGGPRINTAIFLFSRTGLCYEGGYTNESLYAVTGFGTSIMIPATSWYKSPDASLPSAFNKVVYPDAKIISESDVFPANTRPVSTVQNDIPQTNNIRPTINPPVNQPIQTPENVDRSAEYLIIILFVLILGVLLGISIRSRK
jgi:hypothetical protein